MKLPDLIKQAVLSEDWKAVCAVYTAITGEPLSPPKKKEVDFLNMEIPQELLDEIMSSDDSQAENPFPLSSLDEPVDEETVMPEIPKKKADEDSFISKIYRGDRPDFNKKKDDGKIESRKESITIPNVRKNRFVDDPHVASKDLKANNSELQKLYSTSSGRVPRLIIDGEEKEVGVVDVVCSLCGEFDTVAKLLAVGYDTDPENNSYRCNSCSTPSGRAKAIRKQKEMEGSRRK